MRDGSGSNAPFVGRISELAKLTDLLNKASSGNGSSLIISGEAGIGKTLLAEQFMDSVASRDMCVISGLATRDSVSPFQLFESIIGSQTGIFHERESVSFTEIFAINAAGLLMGESSMITGGDLDADIFAGMLSAVQGFVKDSFDTSGQQSTGLGRLEYGDMKILIEHGDHLFLTGIFKGEEHPDMKSALRNTLQCIEEDNHDILADWSGSTSNLGSLQAIIDELSGKKFTVRRKLEGMKLENERLRIADLVLSSIQEKCRDKPILIHMGDLHWADDSSLFVMRYLARNLIGESALMLGTMRPVIPENASPILSDLCDDENISNLELGNLEGDDICDLIQTIYPDNDFPDDFPQRISDQCNGNPFFMTEVLDQMEIEGGIVHESGRYILVSDDIAIPDTIDEAVMRRLEGLSPEALAMAEYASCIGQVFDMGIIASHASLSNPELALTKLEDSGILSMDGDILTFSHPIFQEVIYDNINNRWRSIYHRNLGNYLEVKYQHDIDEVVYDIARHFGRSIEYDKAFMYSVKAAEMAEGSFAPEEAKNFYEFCLGIIPKLRSMSSMLLRKEDIMERLGLLDSILGNYDKALSMFDEAKDITDDPETKARILRLMASIQEKMGEYDKKLELLDTALEILGDSSSDERGRIILAKGQTHRRRGDHEKALELFMEAMSSFAHDGAPTGDIGEVLLAIGLVNWNRGDYASALTYMRRALTNHEAIGYEYGIGAAFTNMANVHSSKGELDKAMENYKKAFDIFNKIGEKYTITILLNNIGNVHEDRGELDEALEYHEKALEIRMRIGMKKGVAYSINNIGNIYRDKGELELAMHHFTQALDILETLGDRYAIATLLENISDVFYLQGDYEQALDDAGRSLDMREIIGDKKGTVSSLHELSIIHLKMDHMDEARKAMERAMDISKDIGAKMERSIGLRLLGNIESKAGNMDLAFKAFAESRSLLEEMNDTKQLPKVIYDNAMVLIQSGREKEAMVELERALRLFESMGLSIWVKETKKSIKMISIESQS